jgi:ATP-dependent Clp protease ATP-binding subunit ClpA
LSDRNVTIETTEAARNWLARKGYDEDYGARPLGRVIQDSVKKPLAEELLFGSLKNGGIVKVDIDPTDDSKLAFEFFPEEPKRDRPAGEDSAKAPEVKV